MDSLKIITRAAAKLQGLKSYYTGQPCKHGHLTRRYTQSGTCSGCIRASNGVVVDNDASARREARKELIRAKFRLYDVDREVFAASVWALTALRYPSVLQTDIDPKTFGTDRDAGTGLYAYDLHPDDLGTLREIATALVRSHSTVAQIEATKRNVILTATVVDTTPPMNFN